MYMYVYRIEYVSYRLGPYQIRIVSAADRIVPALTSICHIQYIKNKIYLFWGLKCSLPACLGTHN